MRTIEFRAWDKDRQKYIYKFDQNFGLIPNETVLIQTEEGNIICGNYQQNADWQEPILEQWTGLHDKNGTKVFEGDKCKFIHDEIKRIEPVIFFQGSFSLGSCISLRQTQIDEFKEIRLTLEIIGNIHNNNKQ